MNTKKEIKKIIAEHSAELAKGTMGYYSIDRKIWLTDEDYLRVYIWGNEIELSLHLHKLRCYAVFTSGIMSDLDSVWRRFRYAYKKSIAEEEEHWHDKKFVAKLKELYSLL